jgi:hypothetical protein
MRAKRVNSLLPRALAHSLLPDEHTLGQVRHVDLGAEGGVRVVRRLLPRAAFALVLRLLSKGRNAVNAVGQLDEGPGPLRPLDP